MGGHRLTRPYRACFRCRIIANREHEIELGCVRPRNEPLLDSAPRASGNWAIEYVNQNHHVKKLYSPNK
jgi:hypothetical protein